MSEPVKKPRKTPGSFTPKKPEIVIIMNKAQIKNEEENSMSVFEKFEVVKCEPYRFIGRSIYIGNKGPNNNWLFEIHEFLWRHCDWVFEVLDGLKEYATSEIHNAVLFTWDKYDGKNDLYGYYVGRFMKANTPVPDGMDYYDMNDEYIAKGWRKGKFGDRHGDMLIYAEGECKEEIRQTGLYKESDSFLMTEVYPKPDKNGESFVGTYITCSLKNSPQA